MAKSKMGVYLFALLIAAVVGCTSKTIQKLPYQTYMVADEDLVVRMEISNQDTNSTSCCIVTVSILNNSSDNIYLPLGYITERIDSSSFYFDIGYRLASASIDGFRYASIAERPYAPSTFLPIKVPIIINHLKPLESIQFQYSLQCSHDQYMSFALRILYNTKEIESRLKFQQGNEYETTNIVFWTVGSRVVEINCKLPAKCPLQS